MSGKFTATNGLVLGAIALVYVAGCDTAATPEAATKVAQQATKENEIKKTADEHGHKPGGHGGIIVEIGRNNYHAEAIFEKGGVLKLYVLGNDEAKVEEVRVQELTAHGRAEGGTEALTFALRPEPQPGDTEGKTSVFAGTLPRELQGKAVEVTIPSIRIGDDRFRVGFKSVAELHDSAMPQGADGNEARKLYLTPGGIYSEADVIANGKTTPSEKYAGLRANHDMRPKAGDKICPITFTKANPRFTWVVGGQTYEFCCTPCIDEFVGLAKEHPEEVKTPGAYVKR